MSLKRQNLDTTTLTFPAPITKNCFFHGSITFVSLFLYQNWWGWKADFWNRRLAWKEWKLKTKLNVECKLLWWVKPSFYPEPSQKASKKAHLCNHQQVDLVSTLRKLFEKGWRQIRLFDKSIERLPSSNSVKTLRTFSLGLLVAWRETYLYVWGVGRVDGDALSDEHPHVGRQVVDLGQVRSPRLKQICWRIGVFFFLSEQQYTSMNQSNPNIPTLNSWADPNTNNSSNNNFTW